MGVLLDGDLHCVSRRRLRAWPWGRGEGVRYWMGVSVRLWLPTSRLARKWVQERATGWGFSAPFTAIFGPGQEGAHYCTRASLHRLPPTLVGLAGRCRWGAR